MWVGAEDASFGMEGWGMSVQSGTNEAELIALGIARETISVRSNWCQNAAARNEHGDVVSVHSANAHSFCVGGAMRKGFDHLDIEDRSDALKLWAVLLGRLDTAATKLGYKRGYIQLNDGSSHATVLRMFSMAIAELSANRVVVPQVSLPDDGIYTEATTEVRQDAIAATPL